MSTLDIFDTLSSPLITSLLVTHPNDIASSDFAVPSIWESWWPWAIGSDDDNACATPKWLQLLRYSASSHGVENPPTTFPSNGVHPNQDKSNVGLGNGLPLELCTLIDTVLRLELNRQLSPITAISGSSRFITGRTYGMSPKKEHEVDRMSAFISSFLRSGNLQQVSRVVDIGSGQGYLSRSLQEQGLHVLALDFNEIQTSGAERWKAKSATRKNRREKTQTDQNVTLEGQNDDENNLKLTRSFKIVNQIPGVNNTEFTQSLKGSLTHKTIHITPQSLDLSIQDWLLSDGPEASAEQDNVPYPHVDPVLDLTPVLFVALHACGSLTLDILRTFLSKHAISTNQEQTRSIWNAHSLFVVGCCYNLMTPHDFPMSSALRERGGVLSLASRHLAAQIPSQWLRNTASQRKAELAIRKVVYRALLQPILQAIANQGKNPEDNASRNRTTGTDGSGANKQDEETLRGVGETSENKRLGKLNDAAYRDWNTFLVRAAEKMDFHLESISHQLPDYLKDERRRKQLESGLSVLHVLRCLLGPLIESLILIDRYDWVREELQQPLSHNQSMDVKLVNLFDQATGSGRNVAIVITPTDSQI
ncbi:methyltransferase domain-containing protein [Hygrophoropsis aurantiaca]|uniref:Methyltransferase domain-containing protein n=1 Tax=Hygrophoropsis aurantiaca TaxID=72124 RepID=A0ACB8AKA8_9AGAM|nr:methyltransferase domain-containing protein [Hygrophoropsis aurantiaca]